MRRLIIMRHAQAAKGYPDSDRKLTETGHWQATIMGGKLLPYGPVDMALVSGAMRTRQTFEDLKLGGLVVDEATFDDELYLAGQYRVLEEIQKIPAAAQTALFVGHEPTTTGITTMLSSGHTRVAREAAQGFGIANAAVLEFTVPWAGLEMRGATVVAFLGPHAAAD